MNFWEARQAAKAGKKVKIVGQEVGKDGGLNWEMWQFVNGWSEHELDAQWEIVEESKTTTKYLNVYPTHYGDWDIHSSAEDAHYHAHSNALLGTIEITVDENGKLISAKKV